MTESAVINFAAWLCELCSVIMNRNLDILKLEGPLVDKVDSDEGPDYQRQT